MKRERKTPGRTVESPEDVRGVELMAYTAASHQEALYLLWCSHGVPLINLHSH